MEKTTLIIGASPKADRYANMAQKALSAAGHSNIPFNPRGGEIDGVQVVTDLTEIEQNIHTVTLYVRPQILEGLMDALISLKPNRVIFNPGTEDDSLQARLEKEGIEVVQACTLVMLKTGQY